MVVVPPFSGMDAAARDSVTARPSSSAKRIIRGRGSSTAGPEAWVRRTKTALASLMALSLTPVMLTLPALAVLPAAMVSVGLAGRVKADVVAGLTGSATTVRVMVVVAAAEDVAETAMTPPFSVTSLAVSWSDMVGVVWASTPAGDEWRYSPAATAARMRTIKLMWRRRSAAISVTMRLSGSR